MIPVRDLRRIGRRASDGAAIGLIVLTLYFHLLHFLPIGMPLPQKVLELADAFRVRQRWGMFTDVYTVPAGWFTVTGRTESGRRVDVLLKGDLPAERPRDISASFINHNWRIYWHRITLEKNRVFRPYLADYLCRTWNEDPEIHEALHDLFIYYIDEKTLPGYHVAEPKAHLLIRQDCRMTNPAGAPQPTGREGEP
ncbi:MAG: hypothetical protein V3U83_04165 [Acidobacteriota bacterium]